jgi:predicted  nucleic acid-binding Zn-ribbon protein
MSLQRTSLPILICVLALLSTQSFAQSVGQRQAHTVLQAPQQSLPQNGNSIDAVANEIEQLRKSVQTLNARLREISDKLSAPDAKPGDGVNDKQKSIALSMDLLGRAEDRAGVLRKQLLEVIEKETTYRARLAQIDEDMRPENIERALSGVGTTRTAEIRDVRRRSFEIEKRGLESLLILTSQNRIRLEEDVRQADQLVQKLRQRLFPLIDKEIEKISPN